MKPYTLATVLVKLLGLSNILSGIVGVVSGISGIFRAMALEEPSQVSRHLVGDVLATMTPYGLLYLVLGLFLLLKARYVVVNLLRISPEEQKASKRARKRG
ncbi:MAG: hypothetical protein PHD76_01050 [Methylacidiphilales bacterium]|nr:hypothetical protein [Candidatus Methylacidiphilales bacterium]